MERILNKYIREINFVSDMTIETANLFNTWGGYIEMRLILPTGKMEEVILGNYNVYHIDIVPVFNRVS